MCVCQWVGACVCGSGGVVGEPLTFPGRLLQWAVVVWSCVLTECCSGVLPWRCMCASSACACCHCLLACCVCCACAVLCCAHSVAGMPPACVTTLSQHSACSASCQRSALQSCWHTTAGMMQQHHRTVPHTWWQLLYLWCWQVGAWSSRCIFVLQA